MAKERKPRPISLALQGGGAHGAFTWGVLNRLSECETIEIKAITATSAGAMNAAAFLSGYAHGGGEGARASLRRFWKSISNRGVPLDALAGNFGTDLPSNHPLAMWSPFAFASAISTFLSPYDLNPFDINPLRDTVQRHIDFDAVRESDVALYISATNVRSGHVKIFTGEEVDCEAVLASACLPQTFKAVEIDGVPYWDGGYLGNPSLFPLYYGDAPGDILLVMLNPISREETPRSSAEIQDRMNEISFNSALLGELRAISFVQKLLSENWLTKTVQSKYRRINMHVIRGGEDLCEFGMESKFDTRWSFLTNLRDRGYDYAEDWLARHDGDIGERSSVDIQAEFLNG